MQRKEETTTKEIQTFLGKETNAEESQCRSIQDE
jgi:hypothetical protein